MELKFLERQCHRYESIFMRSADPNPQADHCVKREDYGPAADALSAFNETKAKVYLQFRHT